MHFLVMIIADESRPLPSTPELVALGESYRVFAEGLVKRGQLRASLRLQPSARTTTLKLEHGRPVLTDGPAQPSPRQLAGVFHLECAHLDEALAIAARVPGLQLGESVEVRPLVPS
jgi:hypothetical protein